MIRMVYGLVNILVNDITSGGGEKIIIQVGRISTLHFYKKITTLKTPPL